MALTNHEVFLDTLAEEDFAVDDPNETIDPPRDRSSDAGRRAIDGLGTERPIADGLEVGATIGEGGMAVLRVATQSSLGRRVVVKTLRPETKTREATLRLLREAWVTGMLEHPNIVPVYDLGLAEDGTPIIVLKRIEGLAWAELIDDGAAVKARFGATDLEEHNLRILVQLCNALSLAHAHGILHRDLKPDNVMIGRFGEVYLVDWGLAVSMKDDPTGRLPLASQVKDIAGTPAYMAPEMLGNLGALSERTDVYQLGGLLFEILAKRAPHVGANFREIAASILLSPPELPCDVSAELAAIVRRAMSRSPDERYASVEELRERLEWYLRHRGSLALSAEAGKRVDELRIVLGRDGESAALRDRVHHLFAEARFGFRQAIRASDDNDVARAGLREVTEMVVAFELERETAEAAAAALADLETPPPELAERVAAAMRVQKARVAELERLQADLDPSTGRRTRVAVAVLIGVLWTILPEVAGWLYRRHPAHPHWIAYIFLGACIWPEQVWHAMSLSTAIFTVNAIVIWGPWQTVESSTMVDDRFSGSDR